MKVMKSIKRFFKQEEGLTTVEYAIAGSLVGLAAIAAFQLLGGNVATVIDNIADVIIAPAAP